MKKRRLGTRVRRLLEERGISQANLSQLTGISESLLSRLLSGDRNWNPPTIETVAGALDMNPDELVEGTEGVDILRPNVGFIEREIHERTVSELARTAVQLQGARAENDGLRAGKAELESQTSALLEELSNTKRDRDTALMQAKESARAADAARAECQNAQARNAVLVGHVKEKEKQVQVLSIALEKANKQVAINYDAYIQANAAAKRLALRVGEVENQRASAALFAGLVGLGIGVAGRDT